MLKSSLPDARVDPFHVKGFPFDNSLDTAWSARIAVLLNTQQSPTGPVFESRMILEERSLAEDKGKEDLEDAASIVAVLKARLKSICA